MMHDEFGLDCRYFGGRSDYAISEHEITNRTLPWCVAVSVIEGEYFVDFEDGATLCVKSGETVFIQSFLRHTVRMERQGRLTHVHFLCRYATIDILSLASVRYFVLKKSEIHEILKRVNLRKYDNEIAQRVYTDKILCELILSLLDMNYIEQQALKIEPWLSVCLQFIHTHARRGISVDEIIAVGGCSKTMFYRMFKSRMKLSPREYIEIERFSGVPLLLLQGKRVKDIAVGIGFNDVSYFSKVFKRIYGLTPNEYKQKMEQ